MRSYKQRFSASTSDLQSLAQQQDQQPSSHSRLIQRPPQQQSDSHPSVERPTLSVVSSESEEMSIFVSSAETKTLHESEEEHSVLSTRILEEIENIESIQKRHKRQDNIELNSSGPRYILCKPFETLRVDHLKTFIIGYGLEFPEIRTVAHSRLAMPRRSISYTTNLSDLSAALNLPIDEASSLISRSSPRLASDEETPSEKLTSNKTKEKKVPTYSYSLRGHVVMYDRWGFVVYSGETAKGGRIQADLFDMERRRRQNAFINVECNESQEETSPRIKYTARTCPVPMGRCMTTMAKHSMKKKKKSGMKRTESVYNLSSVGKLNADSKSEQEQFYKHIDDAVMAESLFTENDGCNDIEQIRINVNDPKEIHHVLLVLNFDAPPSLFLNRGANRDVKKTSQQNLPKVKPYVRLIDVNTSEEIMRYYVEDLPYICVALELSREETTEDRKKLHQLQQFRLKSELHVHIPKTPLGLNIKPFQGTRIAPPTPSDDHTPVSGFAEKMRKESFSSLEREFNALTISDTEKKPVEKLNNASTSGPTLQIPTQPTIPAMPINDTSMDEKKKRDRASSSLSRLTWNVTSLRDEWRFRTQGIGDKILADFLNQVNLNQLGSSNIPKKLPAGFRVHIGQGRNFPPESVLYCLISAEPNGVHQRTKASSSKVWDSSFTFDISGDKFRSCNVVIDVYEKKENDEHSIGQILIPFTMITDPEHPFFEGEFPCCKTKAPFKGLVIGSIGVRLELFWKDRSSIS